MNGTANSFALKLNDCGCCEGLAASTPGDIANRPGLNAIAYRVGSHSEFLNSMLAMLSSHDSSARRQVRRESLESERSRRSRIAGGRTRQRVAHSADPDRIVSLLDYENFTRAYAGIAKSHATWTGSGRTRRLLISGRLLAAMPGGELAAELLTLASTHLDTLQVTF